MNKKSSTKFYQSSRGVANNYILKFNILQQYFLNLANIGYQS